VADTPTLMAVPGIGRVSDWFRWRLLTESWKAGLDADCIAVVMSLESGIRPNLVNPYTGAVGLFGVMPHGSIAKKMGGAAAIQAMSAEEQLDRIVLPHFRAFASKLSKVENDAGAYYMAVFLPYFLDAPDDLVLGEYQSEELLPAPGSKLAKGAVYAQNFTFDPGAKCKGAKKWRTAICTGGKGFYTVADVKAKARGIYNASASRPRIPVPLEQPSKPGGGGAGGLGAGLLAVLGLSVLGIAALAAHR
jgi:hypothetical protein